MEDRGRDKFYWIHRGLTSSITIAGFIWAVFVLGNSGWWFILAAFILIITKD